MPRVKSFRIARLYNVGSYEHVRVELEIDLGPADSARVAFAGAERILAMMDPKNRLYTQTEILQDRNRLQRMREMPHEEFERCYGGYAGTREEYLGRIEANINEHQAHLDRWRMRQARARRLLDDLGGAYTYTDHKLDWEDV